MSYDGTMAGFISATHAPHEFSPETSLPDQPEHHIATVGDKHVASNTSEDSPVSTEEISDTKKSFGHLTNGLEDIEWDKLPEAAKNHIEKNPGMTALQIVLLLVIIVPNLVVGPALALLGLGGTGPIAAFAAPAFHSALGTPLMFRLMQSAAMGGWRAPIVCGVVSAGSAAVNGALLGTQGEGR